MPAVEAGVEAVERELGAYELAFHILPTIAEGEVEGVFGTLKQHITNAGGEIFDEEAAQRFDLAYEIVKYVEGRNRSFGSAYFGWVRFRLDPAALDGLTESVESTKELLRYLLVRLTHIEEATPFRFHEALADKRVKVIGDEEEVAAEVAPEAEAAAAPADAEAVPAVDGEEVKE